MRCTQIRASTGEPCRKLYCDLCIEKRYPDLTFDASATVFACPCCGNFCNCSHCARARGEQYISERNGGWRKWGRWPAPAAAATGPSTPLSSTQQRRGPRQSLTSFVKATGKGKGKGASVTSKAIEVFKAASVSELENWSTAVFTVTGEPLGEALLEGNAAHIVPILPTTPPSTFTSTFRSAPAPTPATAIPTALPPETCV
ncbi:hypothetical protein BJV78DRAFT_695653 [Lactifluus subvellereus]|nr:hypothetical protein BJV78DRAFT_695653 [Lactifluus subvellereus]